MRMLSGKLTMANTRSRWTVRRFERPLELCWQIDRPHRHVIQRLVFTRKDEPFLSCGAGDGNRTHMASLEGWSSTTELHPLDGT